MKSYQEKKEKLESIKSTINKLSLVSLACIFLIIIMFIGIIPPSLILGLVLGLGTFIPLVIVVIMDTKIRFPLEKELKNDLIKQIKDSEIIDNLSYSKTTKTLTVNKKSKFIGEFLYAKPILIDMTTKKPDSLVFTSATVGGVTTGGIEKVEGKSSTRKELSGRYRLIYKKLAEDGTFIPEGEVEFIELSKELLDDAMLHLGKYFYGKNKIEILDQNIKKKKKNSAGTAMILNSAMKVGGNTLASNYDNILEVLEYPDDTKIKSILNWLKKE